MLQAPDEGPEVFEGETILPELDMSLGTATAVSAVPMWTEHKQKAVLKLRSLPFKML